MIFFFLHITTLSKIIHSKISHDSKITHPKISHDSKNELIIYLLFYSYLTLKIVYQKMTLY